MEYYLGYAIVCLLQSWNWLEDRRSEDNKMPKWVWKVLEAKAREIRMVKTGKKEKEVEERKNNADK